jgi:hypothetical protein
MIDRDFWTSTTIAPIGALAELRALVLARSKKRVTLPTVALGSFRAHHGKCRSCTPAWGVQSAPRILT